MVGTGSRLFGLDVRWFGDGDLSARGPPGVANHDPLLDRISTGPVRWDLDGAHYGVVPGGGGLWRLGVRLARRSHRPRARHDAQHFDLFHFHGLMFFRAATLASGRLA